ncbi:MAG: response regulator [Bacteriovoracaceae bacterium]
MNQLPESLKNLNFLVTDDYESMRIMIATHLRELGVNNISFANSGNNALAIIKSRLTAADPVQFLLTDLAMDDGDGIELVRQLRTVNELKKLPILMITSKSDVSLVIDAAKAGVNNYIVKPWQTEELMKKIIDTYNKTR